MKQRLLLLDLLLLVLVVLAGWLLKQRWEAAHKREMAMLQQRIPSIPAPSLMPLVPVVPVTGAMYDDVAQNMLFSRDRNPNIIVDPPAPPPPSPPVPPLPKAHGVIQFGEQPQVILSEDAGGAEKSYSPGDEIGPFKLLAVNTTHILFEWNGLRILKTIEEITDHSAPKEETTSSKAKEAAAPAASTSIKPKEAPSDIDMGRDTKACVPGDTSPSGTLANGMRKVVTSTPFGPSCRWVLAQ
jgi:hypothetical protein